MRMRRKTKRKITKAIVVFCSRDMAAMAFEEEEDEEEERATKWPPAVCSREDMAEERGSPSIIQKQRYAAVAG